jgi:proline dehydrogenase
LRPYGTVNSVPKQNRVPFKSISASIALASSFYLYSSTNGIAEAEAGQPAPLSAFTTSSPTSTKSDLGDENSRLSVHSKSIPDLLLALFVYKLCTLPWLVDAAPHIISLAETLHMEGPVYWIIKQTFFRHFCGGETPEECVSTMDKLALSGINCILDLSVEADLHIGNKDETSAKDESPYSRDDQKADVILEMTKKSIKTAASGSKTNAMVATKITALSPPQLLLRLNQAVTQLEQKFVQYQINGTLDAQGLRQVIQILPAASGPEQEQARSKIVSQLESSQGTLDILEFRKLFNLNGPGRGVWWNTKSTDKKEVLLTNEELAAYDRVMNRLEDICSLARESNVGVMVDAEQSYFQDIIDHLAMNLQRKFNHRSESEEKAPTVFNTCKYIEKSHFYL